MLAGTGLLTALIAYAGGFIHLRDENGFLEERRVSFAWEDLHLYQALLDLFPGEEVRFAESTESEIVLTWTMKDASEREVVRKLAEMSELRIRRIGDAVVVARPSWTWHHYDACDRWFRDHCGFSPWGRPASPERALRAR